MGGGARWAEVGGATGVARVRGTAVVRAGAGVSGERGNQFCEATDLFA